MLVCIQCALRAFVEGKEKAPTFEATIEEHMREHHPDPVATQCERVELEKAAARKLGK